MMELAHSSGHIGPQVTEPSHHPSEDMLLEYASGSMAEPMAVLIATHLALCPSCRQQVADLEVLGGQMLEKTEEVEVGDDLLARLMSELDGAPEAAGSPSRSPQTDASTIDVDVSVPKPLRDYLPQPLHTLDWKGRGVAQINLLAERDDYQSRLLKIRPETVMPSHTHDGMEATLVLRGAFTDRGQRYARGDVALADGSVDHSPVAEAGEDCICFAVNGGPIRLTGPIGRLFNPFVNL
ncbi:MAG: ChrR family anti-sigma-E factor [Pseudomonadota bacterium]